MPFQNQHIWALSLCERNNVQLQQFLNPKQTGFYRADEFWRDSFQVGDHIGLFAHSVKVRTSLEEENLPQKGSVYSLVFTIFGACRIRKKMLKRWK